MKHLVRGAMLVCMVLIFLGTWSLPTVGASGINPANGRTSQGPVSLNASGKGNFVTSQGGMGEFYAVAAVPGKANDAWAVGDGIGTLTEHWNGSQWSLVKSPSPGLTFNNLYGVAALSATNAWAVGSYSNDQKNPYGKALIEHWNGSQWSVVSNPSPGSLSNALYSVVAVSAKDVWAVGSYDFKTLVEHWNGTQWSIVTSLSPNNDAFLYGVTAVSATNVWAVGYYFSSGFSGGGSQTLVEQWNGTTWNVIPSPNSASQNNNLTGVAAVTSNDIWAVGNSNNNNGSQTLIEQWNGTTWSIVSGPNPGSSSNILNAVATVSASNVWAVGGYESGTSGERTLIEQWNGTKWSVVASSNVGKGTNRLDGVVASSANSVWAVGLSVRGVSSQTLTEQWNGTKWSVVTSPNQIGNGSLSSVAPISESSVWAVGSDDRGALTEHWNGSTWSYVASPAPGAYSALSGVAVASATNIWAVGQYATSSGFFNTLTEHWNGTSWSVVTSPNSTSQYNDLTGVAVVSANDIWAVGNSNVGSQTLIEHWNGSTWSIVSSPNPGSSGNTLNAVVAVSKSNVWAVGSSYNSSGIQQTLIERWNGTQWNVVSSPNPGASINDLSGVTAVSASHVWAVGYHDGNNTTQTLIEQWNGTTWSVVTSPNPASGSFLNGVTATSTSNVWAVGTTSVNFGLSQTLIEHWNGSTWSVVTSPSPGSANNMLNAVAVVSASDVWAVGGYASNQYASHSLVEYWNGSTWSVVKSPNVGTPPRT